jgi:AbrB family looped-hinge helix DNA binding protein
LSVNFKTIGIEFLGGCRILIKFIFPTVGLSLVGKMTVEEVTVDQKGRVQIPKSIRDRVGLQVGGKARLKIEKENIVIMPPISPEEFIKEMEGCIKEGTPNTDPLKLKKMWEPTEK